MSFLNMIQTKKNQLRLIRGKTSLELSDLSFLNELSNSSYLSQVENCRKSMSIEVAILYSLICSEDLQKIFYSQINEVRQKLIDRIDLLIPLIEDSGNSRKHDQRIRSLVQLQTQLAQRTLC